MTVYELTTNEGTWLVRHNPRPNMLPYIKQKLAKGVPLAEIISTAGYQRACRSHDLERRTAEAVRQS